MNLIKSIGIVIVALALITIANSNQIVTKAHQPHPTLDCGNDAFANAELLTFICQHNI
jgi:hypothetical protein